MMKPHCSSTTTKFNILLGPLGCSDGWHSLSHAGFATLLDCTEQEGGIFPFSNGLKGELVHCLSDSDLKNDIKASLYAQLLLTFILKFCLN